eukprot:gene5186-10370_t
MTQRSQSIEFVVKPRENLYLEGSIRTLPRVSKGDQYPCQMQKNQSFSCLFRHYAKHNGLRKEDLVFFFVDELLPEETPEAVHLMPYDEIWVEHRKSFAKKATLFPTLPNTIGAQFEKLLQEGDHTDVTFSVGPNHEEICAHKAILSARSEYFKAMFRNGSMVESTGKIVQMDRYSVITFKRMLEFVYTQSVKDLSSCNALDIIQLLMIGNEFLLEDLKKTCEINAAKSLNDDGVGKMIIFSEKYGATELRDACQEYVLTNISTLRQHNGFRQDVADSPELALLLVDVMPDPPVKRRRMDSPLGHDGLPAVNNGSTASAIGDSQSASNTIWPTWE